MYKMQSSKLMLSLTVVFAALGTGKAIADVPDGYTITILPVHPDHVLSVPSAMNNASHVVGTGLRGDDFFFSGVSWDAQGQPTDLGRAVGLETSEWADINENGVVGGSGAIDSLTTVGMPFLVDLSTTTPTRIPLTPLVNDPAAANRVLGLNDQNVSVGFARTLNPNADPFETAVIWDASGIPTDLGTLPGGDVARAFDINNNGVAIGASSTAFDTFASAFRWDAAGGMRLLRDANGVEDLGAVASDLNNDDVIVGTTFDGPTVWFEEANGTILPLRPEDFFADALGINNLNEIVGTSSVSVFGDETDGLLWIDGVVHSIDDLLGVDDFDVRGARRINDNGQILVNAFDFRSGQQEFVHAILTPIPEPSSLALFAIGVCVVVVRRR